MIEFRLSLDALGQTRFGYSPLAELASSLWKIRSREAGTFLQPWLRAVNPRLRSLDLQPLRAIVSPGPLAPSCLFQWSWDPKTTIADQLDRLADLPDDVFRHDLHYIWEGRPPPDAADLLAGGPAARHRLVDSLRVYWDVALEPYWPRIRAVLDDDVAHRAAQVLNNGLYDLLSGLHPEATLHSGALMVDKPHLPDLSHTDSQLTLLPSVFAWPRLTILQRRPAGFCVMYPARGVGRVWETGTGAQSGDALGELLGRTRAAILTRLAIPLSTTQLARELGQSPATVSQHLSVLRRTGLVTSWRAGRSVLYRRTPLASSIVAVSGARTDTRDLA